MSKGGEEGDQVNLDLMPNCTQSEPKQESYLERHENPKKIESSYSMSQLFFLPFNVSYFGE